MLTDKTEKEIQNLAELLIEKSESMELTVNEKKTKYGLEINENGFSKE